MATYKLSGRILASAIALNQQTKTKIAVSVKNKCIEFVC